MLNLKDKSFKFKIQASFFVVAAIVTLLILNDIYNFNRLSRNSDNLNNKVLLSREYMMVVQSEFQNLQLNLLKFSIPGFENQFDKNVQSVNESKKRILETMSLAKDSSLLEIFDSHAENFDKIINEYFGLVVDGTLSAAAMKDFEMASYIATTSGEAVRLKFEDEIGKVETIINSRKEVLQSEVNAIIYSTTIMIIAGSLIGIITFLLTFIKLIPSLTKPVRKFKELLDQYSLGNFDHQMHSTSNDEFGQMAVMLNKLRISQLEKIEAAEKIASGDLDHKINSLSEHDSLSKSFEKMIENLNKLVLEIKFLTTASIKGNSSARGNTKLFNGGYKTIVEGMNNTLDAVYDPINEAVVALEKVASGDFTVKIS
ncbi:MAG: HAMP domain-containing protein, partial [Ignavibacteria bacterium]|nr:HAMP domain-containing protein [Ignavibacteria bacterium]